MAKEPLGPRYFDVSKADLDSVTADDFSTLSETWRRRILRNRQKWQSEWETRALPEGAIIFRLRARARESQYRATVFLVALIFSVFLGLVWFVGLPLWQDYQRGVRDAEAVRAEADLTAREASLQERFAALRRRASVDVLKIWTSETSGTDKSLFDIAFSSARTGWAVGEASTILKTADGGSSWLPQALGPSSEIGDVAFADALTGWVVGSGGTILKTEDGGETWTGKEEYIPIVYNLLEIAVIDASTAWVVGRRGAILKTEDGGSNWRMHNSGTEADLYGISFVGAQTGWITGIQGTLLKTEDGGETWTAQDFPGPAEDLFGVTFTDERKGWAVGNNGTLLVTEDGGGTWQGRFIATRQSLVEIAFADALRGWIVGSDGTILSTEDGGDTWAPQVSGTGRHLFGITVDDNGTVWAVGDKGTILSASGRFSEAILQATDVAELRQALTRANVNPGVDLSAELIEVSEIITQENALAAERIRLTPVGAGSSEEEAQLRAVIALAERTSPEDMEEAISLLDAAPALASDGRTWWADYAQQVPAGILLLFLLATLGSLYRYNTRIAGFYHARADALELMALEHPPDMERFEALAGTLAADRVEFKAAKTPADMATEITKSVIDKLDLKRG